MNQHLVSRVLLRRWANTPKGKVGVLDVAELSSHADYVENLASIKEFVNTGEDQTEKLWGEVEKRLSYAFELVEERKILESEEFSNTIKDCIALHFARSFAMAEIYSKSLPHYQQQVIDGVLAEVSPADVVHAMTGLLVPDASAHLLASDYIGKAFEADVEKRGFLAQLLTDKYEQGRELAANNSLEFWYASDGEFVIGDTPVVSFNQERDAVGVLNGVAWNDADAIVMPLGPNHVVALSKEPAYMEADARTVEWLNVMQVRGALKDVYFRPESGIDEALIDALTPKNKA